jgi:4'-phosphopantetheinyl transferase
MSFSALKNISLYKIPANLKDSVNLQNYIDASRNSTFNTNEELHLWIGKLGETHHTFKDCLSLDEKDRVLKFKLDKQRHYFTLSRILLRSVLSVYTEIPADKIEFEYGNNGKPNLAVHQNKKNIHFNLSHSDGYFACVIRLDDEVGVDIENASAKSKQIYSITKSFFLESEASHINSKTAAEASDLFYKYWTIKEAYIKAKGNSILQLKEVPDLSHLSVDYIGLVNSFNLVEYSGFSVRISQDFYLAAIWCNSKYQCLLEVHI